MLFQTNGAMLIWANVAPEAEAELNDWYTRQHLYERASIAGVLRARRFASDDAAVRYLVIYEADDAAVFAGDEYLNSVNNPRQRTIDVVSGFSDTVRTIHKAIDRYGDDGGVMATIRISSAPDTKDSLPIAACRDLTLRPGMVGATLFVEDEAVSTLPNTEKDLRGVEDERCAAVLVLEALDVESARQQAEELTALLTAAGYTCHTGIYRHLSTKYHGTDRDF